MTNPTVEEHLAEWAAQSPTCVVTRAEWDFIHQMRRSAAGGVGFGWMQGIIEVEWTAKHGAHGWGPRYFEATIARLRAENLALVEKTERLRRAIHEITAATGIRSVVAAVDAAGIVAASTL